MPFQADAITLLLLAVLAILVVGILAYAANSQLRRRRRQRDIAAINATILDYFRRSGVAVAADCTRLHDDGPFVAVIESEPMKRFRLSHIIEMTVREHVRKNCGLELEKIYWRFPIKEAAPAAADAAAVDSKNSAEASDDYINEGLEHYRHIPKPEVEELPWESFEQASGSKEAKPGRPEA